MEVKEFDKLERRDFDNGGFIDDIRRGLMERDSLRAQLAERDALLREALPIVQKHEMKVASLMPFLSYRIDKVLKGGE